MTHHGRKGPDSVRETRDGAGDTPEPFGHRTSFRLLRSAQRGDESHLNKLCQFYLPKLRRWSRGRLPRWARDLINTDDLIQETLVRTVRHTRQFEYRHEGAFQAYLRKGLKNRIKDEVRRVKRRGLQASVKSDLPAQDTSPVERVIGKEVWESYERAFERLRSPDQQAIFARFELSLSYKETAEILGKNSADSARMAVSRALVRLAREMAATET